MNDYIRDGRAPIPENENISKVMRANKGKDTNPELQVRRELRLAGFPGYRLHWKNVPGRPDISYPGRKIAIFVNGCFWHRCPVCRPSSPKTNKDFWGNKFDKNIERDKRKIEELSLMGWNVFILWECQIKESPSISILPIIEEIRKLTS